ncbi:MAG: peroxiredoxin [Promethearchaeota archaeon]
MIKILQVGDNVPFDIELLDQDGEVVKLADYKGKKLIIYFYPKDDTPGCTTEAKNFRDSIKEYEGKGIAIIGISADSIKSHKKFQEKYNLPFTLLSDPEKKVAKIFGALEDGRVRRRTWLINEQGVIEKVFEKVSASKHNEELCTYYGIKRIM